MRELRTKTIRFRVSESEYEAILAQIPPGIGISAWCRERLMPPTESPRSLRRPLVAQVAKIGNNLNQIARGVNTANATGTRFDLALVLQALRKIDQQLKELLK